jgi:hypothetical protein
VVGIDPCAFEPVLTDQLRTFSRLHDTRTRFDIFNCFLNWVHGGGVMRRLCVGVDGGGGSELELAQNAHGHGKHTGKRERHVL